MRRQYKGRSDASMRSAEGEQGFWPSYADMMSAVALILFFLMLLSYISNMITGNSLKDTESQLADTRTQLAIREQELNSLEDSLALTKQQVEYLVHLVDDLNLPVIAYGLRADFQGNFFEGSQWLIYHQR